MMDVICLPTYLPTSSTLISTYCYSATASVVLDLYPSLFSLIAKHQQSYLHQIIIISFYNPLPEEEEEE